MDAHDKNPEAIGDVKDLNSGTEPQRHQGEFPRRLAHAMRSPLGLIRGAIKELADAQSEGRTLQPDRLLDFALRGTVQLERMADRLSMAGRLQRSEELARSACDLRGIVQAAVAEVQSARSRRRVTITLAEPPASVSGQGDASLLRLAVGELIDNALRMAREQVVIRFEPSSMGVTIVIVDDGELTRGVPELSPSLVHPAADGTGLGLGLGLAQRVVALHGGALSLGCAEGSEARGLVVRVDLPGFTVQNA